MNANKNIDWNKVTFKDLDSLRIAAEESLENPAKTDQYYRSLVAERLAKMKAFMEKHADLLRAGNAWTDDQNTEADMLIHMLMRALTKLNESVK